MYVRQTRRTLTPFSNIYLFTILSQNTYGRNFVNEDNVNEMKKNAKNKQNEMKKKNTKRETPNKSFAYHVYKRHTLSQIEY